MFPDLDLWDPKTVLSQDKLVIVMINTDLGSESLETDLETVISQLLSQDSGLLCVIWLGHVVQYAHTSVLSVYRCKQSYEDDDVSGTVNCNPFCLYQNLGVRVDAITALDPKAMVWQGSCKVIRLDQLLRHIQFKLGFTAKYGA
jgi:hypothetical protein